MAARAARRVLWWYLSCFASSVEGTASASVSDVPIFPGGWMYVSSSARANRGFPSREDSTFEREETEAEKDEEDDAAELRSSQKRCSLFLVAVRTAALVVSFVILSLYGRMWPFATETQNSTRAIDD